MSKRASRRTKKQDRIEYYRRFYGTSNTLYCFEFRKPHCGGDHIGCVPAPDVKTAFRRLIKDKKNLRHDWQVKVLVALYKKKKLKKYVRAYKITVEEQLTYVPAKIP